MENCYAVRITLPYLPVEDGMPGNQPEAIMSQCVRRVVTNWSSYVKKIVVYEHDDDGANHIHCHVMLEDCSVSKKRLQQIANEGTVLAILNPGHRRTSLMSFRSKDYDGHINGFAYCTKGKYDPKYIQGWTIEQANEWKAAWVAPSEHVKRDVWRVLFEHFSIWWNEKDNRLSAMDEMTTEAISSRVHKYLMHLHQGLYKPQCKQQRWFLITNMCQQYRVSFPKDWKL